MHMKSIFRKALATFAAGAMSMALVMPVFAEDGTTTNEAYIQKTYNTEVGKAETFSFIATPKQGDGLITTDKEIIMPSISFDGTETGTQTKRGQINFPEYKEAGHYEYTVTENQGVNPSVTSDEHEKMIMSEAEYTMDVYVSNTDSGYEISNIIVNKTKDDKGDTATGKVNIGDTDKNGFNFTNTYVQEAGTGDTPSTPGKDYADYGSLNVSKTINGNGGTIDTDKTFEFTANFTFPTETDATTLGGVKDKDGNTITLENNSYTFKLKNGENMKFTGLPVGTKISLTESATPNYKGSAEVTINGQDPTSVTATSYNSELKVIDAANETKLGQKTNKADVTNTYNNVPLTGIIMNNLPYIGMIVIGAAALVLYVQNKRKKLQ